MADQTAPLPGWGQLKPRPWFHLDLGSLSHLRQSLPHDLIASDIKLKQVSGSLTIIFVDLLDNNEARYQRCRKRPSRQPRPIIKRRSHSVDPNIRRPDLTFRNGRLRCLPNFLASPPRVPLVRSFLHPVPWNPQVPNSYPPIRIDSIDGEN